MELSKQFFRLLNGEVVDEFPPVKIKPLYAIYANVAGQNVRIATYRLKRNMLIALKEGQTWKREKFLTSNYI